MQIQSKVSSSSYAGKYAFLKDFEYTLGADQLTEFGQAEMYDSGVKFYKRYSSILKKYPPFVRASGEQRVIDSADYFTSGFNTAKSPSTPSIAVDVTISEDDGSNNTLSHNLCTNFENSETGHDAQATWSNIFVPPIQERLNKNLPGANLSIIQTIYMMDLCPFETLIDANETSLSPFCKLFTVDEFEQYSYYETLDKYYGHGSGSALGPTQGVGWVNELIARLTNSPVIDHTSVNHTLDDSNVTFPLGRRAYADFSHDNDMAQIYSALGLFNVSKSEPALLSNTSITSPAQADGFWAAWLVPYGARLYVEGLNCPASGSKNPKSTHPRSSSYSSTKSHPTTNTTSNPNDITHVRLIINDRVMPLHEQITGCGQDSHGRCQIDTFLNSLAFAKSGGLWDQCLV